MRNGGKKLTLRILAAAAAAVMSISYVPAGNIFAEDVISLDGIEALELRQAELEEERLALEETIRKYADNVEKQEEYLELYNRKMAVQEEEMDNISKQIEIINTKLRELDIEIKEKQVQVDDGIALFRERLRAMYMAGNESIAEVIAGSANFYDMLARMELVERVSRHDSEMIGELVSKVRDLDSDKAELESERTALDEKKATRQTVLEELRVTYANHVETKEWYESQAAAHEERTAEIIEEEARVEEELQDHIRKQQAEVAERMAEKRAKQEEARRQRDERRRQKEEARKAAEEEARKAAESQKNEEQLPAETQAPAGTQAAVTTTFITDELIGGTEYSTAEYFDDDDFEDVTAAPEDMTVLPSETTVTSYELPAEETTVTTTVPREEVYEQTAPTTSNDFYDPYEDYQMGHSYYEDLYDDEEEDIYNGDKGYGTYDYTGFIWPVPSVRNITDGYGNRYIEEEGSSSFHKGIDINKPNCKGEPIIASAGGVVITASNTGNGYGIHVVIDHGDGIATLYGHMSSTCVEVGDEVQQGQVIGYIGNTGYAYGYHCHFEVRVDGQHTDPMKYVSMDK